MHAAQRVGVQARSLGSGEHNGLIGADSAGRVDGMGATPVKLCVHPGPGHEEGARLGQSVEPREVHVAAVEQVKRARFEDHLIEDIDIVHLASGDVNTGRNTGAYIEQGVQLDGALVAAKLRPGKKFQAQIDGGGIEGVDRVGELDAQGFVAIELAGGADQALREIAKDAPVAMFVGIGQGTARDPAANAHVVELGSLYSQQASMSRRLSRYVSCAKARQRNWSSAEKLWLL